MTTAAKIEANRRNAKKSTGPRSIEGKNRSRFNAVKHGLTAKTDVLPNEDPQAFEERIDDWTADLRPRGKVERNLIERAARMSWQLDRADRAQTARLTACVEDVARREHEEVMDLGRRLFWDPRGSTELYGATEFDRCISPDRTSWSGKIDDPDDPPRLVSRLQSTAVGCQWMLDQWAELRARIKSGGCWQSPDKFKAIRLLGRQPIAAADVADVATIFQAAFVLDNRREHAFAELRSELFSDEMSAYKDRLTGRRLESFGKDETRARQALLEIVDRATEVVSARLDLHRQRADLDAALAADRVSFDDSQAGDRLRRYELSANRVMLRNLDEFFKVRREAEDPEPAAEAERGIANAEQGAVAKPTPGRDPATFTDAEWAALDPSEADAIFYGLFDDDKSTQHPKPAGEDQPTDCDDFADCDDAIDYDEPIGDDELSGDDDFIRDDDLPDDDDLDDDGNISCEDDLSDDSADPSDSAMHSPLADGNHEKEATLAAGPNSPIEATAGAGPNSPIEATAGVGSNSPIEATAGADQSSPIEATAGADQSSPIEATAGAEQNSPIEATAGVGPNLPIEATAGDDQSSPIEAIAGDRPCSPIEVARAREPYSQDESENVAAPTARSPGRRPKIAPGKAPGSRRDRERGRKATERLERELLASATATLRQLMFGSSRGAGLGPP